MKYEFSKDKNKFGVTCTEFKCSYDNFDSYSQKEIYRQLCTYTLLDDRCILGIPNDKYQMLEDPGGNLYCTGVLR